MAFMCGSVMLVMPAGLHGQIATNITEEVLKRKLIDFPGKSPSSYCSHVQCPLRPELTLIMWLKGNGWPAG